MEGTKDAKNNNAEANQNASKEQPAATAPSIQLVKNGTQEAQKLTKKQLEQKKLDEASESFKKVVGEFYSSYAKYNFDFLHLGVNRIKESMKAISGLLDTNDSTKAVVLESSKVIRKYVKSLDNSTSEFFSIIASGVADALFYRAEIQQARSLEKSGLYYSNKPISMSIKVDTERKRSVWKQSFRKEDNMGVSHLNGSTVNSTLKSKTAAEKVKEAKEQISARISENKKLIKDSETARKELAASTEFMVLKNARNFVLDKSNHDSVAKEVIDFAYKSNKGFKSEVVNGSDLSKLIKKTEEYSAAYKKSADEYRAMTYNRRKLMRISKDIDRLSTFLRRMENVIG